LSERRERWLWSALAALIAAACASPVPPHEVERLAGLALDAAEGHLADGNPAEAAELVNAVLVADPDHGRAQRLHELATGREETAYAHPWLGSNFARRAPVDRSPAARVLLFLPDRLLDLADVVSLDVHLGFGLFANVHATRAAQLGLGSRGVRGFGWHEKRSLGVRTVDESSLTLLAFGGEATAGALEGTSGVFAWSEQMGGLHEPGDPLYQGVRDYWGLGAAATILLLGLDVELHPVQLADFAAGLAGADPLNDDLGRTRGLRLTRYERDLVAQLLDAARR
jgi:hypothetical protein